MRVRCPIDGDVEVSLDDVDSVVLGEGDRARVVFTCPVCGESIHIVVMVPGVLMASIEGLADENDDVPSQIAGLVALVSATELEIEGIDTGAHEDDPVADSYCEYFRRQLAKVTCVEDLLAEIDADSGR